jgi:phosphopantothenoylcysteine decarboxylase/phosphopantothenate--cysteine ligase
MFTSEKLKRCNNNFLTYAKKKRSVIPCAFFAFLPTFEIMVTEKKILLCVTGSIAAYKSALLVRLLVKQGAQVRVIMTHSATEFITPLTLSVLSKNMVLTELSTASGNWNNHVELGLWADIMLIAPASANTIAKLANGLCDNLLCATYLSARCPVLVAPAMDLDMWKHPVTQRNIEKLKNYGNIILPVNTGELASGLTGEGRMAEPEEIVQYLQQYFSGNKSSDKKLQGKKVLITAGPTVEAIDPIRFISNHSTGKMGFALAEAFLNEGAEVTMVKGPTPTELNVHGIRTISVTNAYQMHNETIIRAKDADIIVMAAAVADYTPEQVAPSKIKKQEGEELEIKLVKTPDILKELGERKKTGQILVGFALETENELENAIDKLNNKNLDLIVLNSLQDKGAGFGHDTNQITIIGKNKKPKRYELKPKKEVAKDIINEILHLLT